MTPTRRQEMIAAIRTSERIADHNEYLARKWKAEGEPWWRDCADVALHERNRIVKWHAELRANR